MTRLPAVLASAIGALANPNKLQKTFKIPIGYGERTVCDNSNIPVIAY